MQKIHLPLILAFLAAVTLPAAANSITMGATSSATNAAGTGYGQQPDAGAPSMFDIHVTNSTDPFLTDGLYDGYCLNPHVDLGFLPSSSYNATVSAGNSLSSFTAIGYTGNNQADIDRINWLLSRNYTSDPAYNGQFNFGEMQTAIWKILGFTDLEIASAGLDRFLNDNNRNVLTPSDIDDLLAASQTAISNGAADLPSDPNFTMVVDPEGAQPLIAQRYSIAAVPESSSAVLSLLGASVGLGRRRR